MQEFTTIENLQGRINTRGALLEYKDHVLVTDLHWKRGYTAEIYEFIDDPIETGINKLECRLSLIKESSENFEDNGSAIQWCFKQI